MAVSCFVRLAPISHFPVSYTRNSLRPNRQITLAAINLGIVKRNVRVLLCDDHTLIRTNVRRVIGDLPGFEVVGEAEAGNVGVQMATDLAVDLVVMDVSMPELDGIEATRQILAKSPQVKVLIFSSADHETVPNAFSAGAHGYLLKGASAGELHDAVKSVMSGERYLSQSLKTEDTPAGAKPQPAPHVGASLKAYEGRVYKVALVDDSDVVRERVAATLSSLGGVAVVGQAGDVPEGLRLVRETKPDLLILDIGLPGESGITLLEIVKKEQLVPFVMMLTNQDHPKLREHCMELGANYYFHKPTEFEKMIDLCSELANAARSAHSPDQPDSPHPSFKIPVETIDPEEQRAVQLDDINKQLRDEIAARQRAEHALRESQTQLRQLEDHSHEQAQLLDLAYDAIIIRDLEDRVLFWNKSAQSLYGWAATEVLGRRIAEFLPDDTTTSLEVRKVIFETGAWSGEVRLNTRKGCEIVVESRLTLIRDRDGKPKSVLAVNTNITERKRLETHFLRSQRMESIGMLAGGIAHDLNNVLAPIIMSTQLLDMETSDPGQKKKLNIIMASARRGADLVRQILTFYRNDQRTHQELSPAYLIKELRHIVGETFPKCIQVNADAPKGLWQVAGEPTQLHQVLMNLCVNSRDAMPSGGTLVIEAENVTATNPCASPAGSPAKPAPYVLISVRDTGTGIAPEIREKIFEPFFTTKAPGKGTGLGLSTSLAIVKSHGGFIQVESEVGTGSVFRIYLPALDQGASTSSQTEQFQIPRGRGELVLVVDDEASVRLIMAQTLKTYGYRTLTANDGAEAVMIYQQRAADIAVVLVDLMMPVMDGVATIRKLAEINPKLKVIAVSGLESSDALAQAGESCARAFLPKPYTAANLLKTLSKILSEGGENQG